MNKRTEEEAKAIAILLGGEVFENRVFLPSTKSSNCRDCVLCDDLYSLSSACHVMVNVEKYDSCDGIIWIEVP